MNASQIHLALTHVPVILSIIGLTILIIALARKNDTLIKTSLWIFSAAGIFTLPVYFTGEGAEEIVEGLPGVSKDVIGKHEEFATVSLTIILICAVISLTALVFYKYSRAINIMKYAVLLLAFGTAITMVQTAHLGGQIRHTEIQSGFAFTSNDTQNKNAEKKEDMLRTSEKNKARDDD